MNNLKTIIQALRPYIRVDYKALLNEALNGNIGAFEPIFGDQELDLLYYLADKALASNTVGIDPAWQLARVQSVEYYLSSNGNPTYKLNALTGLTYVRKDTPQQIELLSLYPDLAKLTLKQVVNADFDVYVSQDGQWLKCEKIVSGGVVVLNKADERQVSVIQKAFGGTNLKNLVFLDVETTGLVSANDTASSLPEICSYALMEASSEVYTSYVKPQNPNRLLVAGKNGVSASDVNGITPDILNDAPNFPTIYQQLRPMLEGKTLVTYSAFDIEALKRDIDRHSLELFDFEMINMMEVYAEYVGESKRGGGFKWHKLADAYQQVTGKTLENAHSALADTEALYEITNELIHRHLP